MGWGPRLRPLLGEDAPDGPVPDDVFAAVVDVLRGLGLGTPAGRRGRGRVRPSARSWSPRWPSGSPAPVGWPHLGTIGRTDQPAHAAHEQRAAGAPAARRVPGRRRTARPRLRRLGDEPVLLVDDLIDSGWTAALAGRELRRAGAAAVLPFALAQTG